MVKRNGLSFLKDTFSMVLVALFIAIYGVLSLLRIYIIPNQLRLSLTFMPVAWAAMLFGPVAGALTGAIGDVVGWVVNPVGAFFPGFTVSACVTGIIYGIFFYRKDITLKRAVSASAVMIMVVEVGLNSVWLNILAGSAYKVIIGARLIKALITIPVQTFILYTTGFLLKKLVPAGIRGI